MEGPGVGRIHTLNLIEDQPSAYPIICGWTPINQPDSIPNLHSPHINISPDVEKPGNPKVQYGRTSKKSPPKRRIGARAVDKQHAKSRLTQELETQVKLQEGICAPVVSDHRRQKRIKVESAASPGKGADKVMKTMNLSPLRKFCTQNFESRPLSDRNQPPKPRRQYFTEDSAILEAATSGRPDPDRSRCDAPLSDLAHAEMSKSLMKENDGSSITLEDSCDDFEVMAEQPKKCWDGKTSTVLSEATETPIKTLMASKTTLDTPKRYQGCGSKTISKDPIFSMNLSRPSRRLSSDPRASAGQYLSNVSASLRNSPKPASQQITIGNECRVRFSPTSDAVPFVRPPFPRLVLDRSPILGFSNQAALRVCFRIGEALNAAAWALRNNIDVTVELYARLVTSVRRGHKQYFSFADLFTDKPPYLKGIWSMWKGVALWDEDAKLLLGKYGEGKMCRVLGKVNKEDSNDWEISITCAWAIGWEDVGAAKASVCL